VEINLLMYQEFLGKKTGGHTDTVEGRRTRGVSDHMGGHGMRWPGQLNSCHSDAVEKKEEYGGQACN